MGELSAYCGGSKRRTGVNANSRLTGQGNLLHTAIPVAVGQAHRVVHRPES